MDKKLLKQFVSAKKKYEDAKLMYDATKQAITETMQKDKVDKMETSYGRFTIGKRKSYKYSDKIQQLQDKVKIAKVKEEEKGIAKCTISEYLVYTQIK